LKSKHFSEDSDISEESFKNLLKKLADINHTEFVAKLLGLKVKRGPDRQAVVK